MDWKYCFGRECKLGWGYNASLHLFIPAEERPGVTSEVENYWTCSFPSSSSLSDISTLVSFLFIDYIHCPYSRDL